MSDRKKATRDEALAEQFTRAKIFVRDCFRIMGQPHDAENNDLVIVVANKVLRAINNVQS